MIRSELEFSENQPVAVEIDPRPDGCIYRVDEVEVKREDFLAILALARADTLADINYRLSENAENGIVSKLDLIYEALNPEIEDTFARRIVDKLQLIAEMTGSES